jgi:hypothetical protein
MLWHLIPNPQGTGQVRRDSVHCRSRTRSHTRGFYTTRICHTTPSHHPQMQKRIRSFVSQLQLPKPPSLSNSFAPSGQRVLLQRQTWSGQTHRRKKHIRPNHSPRNMRVVLGTLGKGGIQQVGERRASNTHLRNTPRMIMTVRGMVCAGLVFTAKKQGVPVSLFCFHFSVCRAWELGRFPIALVVILRSVRRYAVAVI